MNCAGAWKEIKNQASVNLPEKESEILANTATDKKQYQR